MCRHTCINTIGPKSEIVMHALNVCRVCVCVLQPWQSEEEGSWLREYPVTLMQFFRYLYHNVPDLNPMWHSPEFLCALAATVFPFNIRPYSEMVLLLLYFQKKLNKGNFWKPILRCLYVHLAFIPADRG